MTAHFAGGVKHKVFYETHTEHARANVTDRISLLVNSRSPYLQLYTASYCLKLSGILSITPIDA